MTTDEAVSALETAFQVEVEYRHGIYNGTTVQQEYIRRAAECLTNKGQKFGIFMVGGPGNGKTTLMKAIQSLVTTLKLKNEYNERMYVVFTTAKEIERLCQENYTGFKRLCDKPLLAIDDFGAENVDVKVYGNVINPVTDLLSHRYDEQLFTMMTSNLPNRKVREEYGDRLADRLNEMMEVIVFTNSSFRGKKSDNKE